MNILLSTLKAEDNLRVDLLNYLVSLKFSGYKVKDLTFTKASKFNLRVYLKMPLTNIVKDLEKLNY